MWHLELTNGQPLEIVGIWRGEGSGPVESFTPQAQSGPWQIAVDLQTS